MAQLFTYDTHVPLVFFGMGIKKGRREKLLYNRDTKLQLYKHSFK